MCSCGCGRTFNPAPFLKHIKRCPDAPASVIERVRSNIWSQLLSEYFHGFFYYTKQI